MNLKQTTGHAYLPEQKRFSTRQHPVMVHKDGKLPRNWPEYIFVKGCLDGIKYFQISLRQGVTLQARLTERWLRKADSQSEIGKLILETIGNA